MNGEVVFGELEDLYREVEEQVTGLSPRCEMSGVCCRFEEAGHELFATGLEADYAVHRHPQGEEPEAPGRCPYHVKGLCTAREGRPLGCRTYFCDDRTEEALLDVHEVFLRRIRSLAERAGYLPTYGRFPAMVLERGVGQGEETS
jgi:Fe-S-cluster containining protein